MVHVWTSFFVPALVCAFAAVALFLVALAHDHFSKVVSKDVLTGLSSIHLPEVRLIVIAIVAAGALLLPIIHYRRNQPKLGFED
jgi:hypothetical protein